MLPLFLLAAADTLIFRQVPPVRSGFEETVFVASGLAQILTLVALTLLALIFHRMWKAQLALHEQLARLTSKVDPMIASATSAAENVRVLTDVVRKDAVRAADALAEATSRVRDSVGGIADRIDDFGDLMGRVHGKADEVADVAEAALDTIKLGSRVLRPRHDREREPERRPDDVVRSRKHPAAPDRDRAAPPDDVDDRIDRDEEHDDSPYASVATEEPPKAPRRRRRRGRGRRPAG
ncbi:MAG: hypothetical protein AABZ29_02810 [Gemmatimonadota bacterium]